MNRGIKVIGYYDKVERAERQSYVSRRTVVRHSVNRIYLVAKDQVFFKPNREPILDPDGDTRIQTYDEACMAHDGSTGLHVKLPDQLVDEIYWFDEPRWLSEVYDAKAAHARAALLDASWTIEKFTGAPLTGKPDLIFHTDDWTYGEPDLWRVDGRWFVIDLSQDEIEEVDFSKLTPVRLVSRHKVLWVEFRDGDHDRWIHANVVAAYLDTVCIPHDEFPAQGYNGGSRDFTMGYHF